MDLNTQQEIHLSHYWNVIRKRWKVAAAIVLVVMIGTFLASYFSKPLYQSWIQIEVEEESQNVTIEDLFGIASSDQEFLQTQYELLKSRGLAQRVIEDHKLLYDRDFYGPGVEGKTPAEIAQITQSMAGGILGGVSIAPKHGTNLVVITYTAGTPKLAQKLAEGWGDSFIRMTVAKKLDSVKQATEFLSQQIATVQSNLEESRQDLLSYGKSKGIISVDEGSGNVTVQKLEKLNADVTTAQGEFYDKQAKYNTIQNTSPDAVAQNDATVAHLTEEISRLQRDYNTKQAQYTAAHPVMQDLAQQIEKTKIARASAVKEAYNHALEEARAQVASASSRESSVRSAYENQRTEAQKLNVDAAKYFDLRMAVDAKQTLLAALQKQLNETQVTARLRGSASSNVHWVDHAELPGSRINLSMKKNLQTAFPLGLFLGFAAIFFLEYMDRSIKTPEELERVTKFASLGVIPAAGTISRQYGYNYSYGRPSGSQLRAVDAPAEEKPSPGIELLPHLDARSPVSEAYRAFRTSLLLASANSPKIIVITSSFAREGKTTTSVNLATVLAQMGKPVLLVDADLRRPRLQKVFPGKMNLGLVNYLAANIPFEDTVQPTQVPNLSVVLSGPIPPNPSELLASDRMKHLIQELRDKYAFVIFDSPPVLAVTDAIVLAASADGVVLTVHGGHTPRELVQRSAERLRLSNIPVLGALLNNLDLQQYGYTYRKSYYDYYDSNQDNPERRGQRAEGRR
jgi:capsular exopolysaccharide synthesis family protein